MSNSHHSIYFPDNYLYFSSPAQAFPTCCLRDSQPDCLSWVIYPWNSSFWGVSGHSIFMGACNSFHCLASGVMRPAQQISRNLLGFKIVNFNLKEKMFPFFSYIWNKRLKNMWVASCYSDSSKISKSKSQSFYIAFSECSTISPSLWNFLITRIIIFRRLFPARTPFTTVSVWGSASTLCAFPKVPSWTFDKLSHGPASSSQFLNIFMHDCQNLSFLYYR